jgi:hypothetical protein
MQVHSTSIWMSNVHKQVHSTSMWMSNGHHMSSFDINMDLKWTYHISPFNIHVDVKWAFHKHVEWTKLSPLDMNNAHHLSKCALYIADMTFHTRCFMFHENHVLMTLACRMKCHLGTLFVSVNKRVVAISVCCYVGIDFHQLSKLQKY